MYIIRHFYWTYLLLVVLSVNTAFQIVSWDLQRKPPPSLSDVNRKIVRSVFV